MTDGPARLWKCLGAATLLHLALLPLLGFAVGGRGGPGGKAWRQGVTVELFDPEATPPVEPAPATRSAAKRVPPVVLAPSTTIPPPAATEAPVPRREASVPRGRRTPRGPSRAGTERPAAGSEPAETVVAVADPLPGVASDAASATPDMPPVVGASPSPVAATGPPGSTDLPPGTGTEEPRMGCAATADGFVCTRRESDVLNRPQQFMGYEVSSGYQEREYRFEREGDSYVYRPDSHNAVILHEDGTVEIESGPKPSDALCILGGAPLPWDIPEIPHYQFQELQEETADVRRQLAERAEASRLDDALRGLSDELTAELERGTRSLAEQRRFLFLRWDECTESGGGLEARRIIEELARRRFPRDSPRQYTPAELEELNRGRASNAPFCPYGCP